MNEAVTFLLLISLASGTVTEHDDDECTTRFLTNATAPSGLSRDLNETLDRIGDSLNAGRNLSATSWDLVSFNPRLEGVILGTHKYEILALNINKRLKIFPNRTTETESFWKSYKTGGKGWRRPFKDCHFFRRSWFYVYNFEIGDVNGSLFVKVVLNQCDVGLKEIFNGTHRCDEETERCVADSYGTDQKGRYRCLCREGYFHPGANASWKGFHGQDVETGIVDSPRCTRCPSNCDDCQPNGICLAKKDVYLKTEILIVQIICMAVTVILGLVVFKQRKTKSIATGMWTILETILLGIFILYSTVVVRIFEPSVVQCLLEPWAREVGFIICYGAIILKLYRHLIEFRTRKAHRWVVKDTDLLKYLLIMITSVLAYMAAYTSITLNFMQENYSLLYVGTTSGGVLYQSCKSLWWDYVTETGELVILIFGIHLSYASRNARTQFHERNFLCAAISIELTVSTLFYVSRVLILPELHPNIVLIIYCVRTQLSTTVTLLLVFVPKFWYQQKQVRSLGQEYSCRIPIEGFKDINAHGPLTGNNSDVDVGEVTLADMSPDDIRAELKRLYLQLEIFKSKTICRDNPHISKRRGGRKAQHRRFSLQNLHGKNRDRERQKQQPEETTEAEPSRTPEDSVCSNEGPSAVYADLPSTTHTSSDVK
ncbi:probable G-protein coupled receptor 158 isoform X2 [Aethina tumida]|uniref:probable G-protein coupled receptor 158 isoform X2 n=1 Tax=Aethina tumida TaxID=116153 RepID=UPI002147528B|nr:probable G-protein coupled receptor 158 isoform X2 [Aethina tumida]